MTSSSHLCLVSKIWQWCIPRRIWTIVTHISQFKLSAIYLTLMLLKGRLKGDIWIIPLNDIEINVSASFPNCCFAPTSLTLICQSRSTKEEWRKNSQEWDKSFHSLAARINEIHNSMSFIRLTFTYSLRLLATNSHCQSSSSDGVSGRWCKASVISVLLRFWLFCFAQPTHFSPKSSTIFEIRLRISAIDNRKTSDSEH